MRSQPSGRQRQAEGWIETHVMLSFQHQLSVPGKQILSEHSQHTRVRRRMRVYRPAVHIYINQKLSRENGVKLKTNKTHTSSSSWVYFFLCNTRHYYPAVELCLEPPTKTCSLICPRLTKWIIQKEVRSNDSKPLEFLQFFICSVGGLREDKATETANQSSIQVNSLTAKKHKQTLQVNRIIMPLKILWTHNSSGALWKYLC